MLFGRFFFDRYINLSYLRYFSAMFVAIRLVEEWSYHSMLQYFVRLVSLLEVRKEAYGSVALGCAVPREGLHAVGEHYVSTA